jgi:hypothetical protein
MAKLAGAKPLDSTYGFWVVLCSKEKGEGMAVCCGVGADTGSYI